MLAWADAIANLAHARGARLVVNDRADIALMAGAGGVHVGQDDMPPRAVRAAGGAPPFEIGLSTHTQDQIAAAASEPIDYLAVGPVFGTSTKDTGYAAVGLDMVRAAVQGSAGRPVVAIGGITLENAGQVMRAGASSVAVISGLLAGDPARQVAEYLERCRV
jgi:thiamine-phosphate pyrophosphorylase